jgi:glycosyltransferase involved in cell wall biosynthesis
MPHSRALPSARIGALGATPNFRLGTLGRARAETSAPLRIVHVDAERSFGGGERQVFLLLEGLRSRGHGSLLVCPPGSACEAEARGRGLSVRAVPMRNDADLGAVLRLRRVLRDEQPDLIHLHTGRATWLGGLAARSLGLPALTTRRMDRPLGRGWRTRLVHRHLTRASVAISAAVERRLREGGVPEERLRRVPSAVDPEELRSRKGRQATRAAEGAGEEIVVLSVAALVQGKGLDVLLHALATLAAEDLRPQLWIAGDGPERAVLEELAATLAVKARFLGRRRDVPDLLAACDLFVLPSRNEGLGVAALEAMAAGRAVVASRVGGLAEAVVDERTGLLVPPGDAASLARALARLAREPALRARLGAAGPGRIGEGFRADQLLDAYEAIYREVLAVRSQNGS